MQKLLDFLYQQREVGIFLGLEIVSIWLLISYNSRYNASFFNSCNEVYASITQTSEDVSDYFRLKEINLQLMLENERLLKENRMLSTQVDSYTDTVDQFQVIGAKIINNTFNRSANFLTISAGRKDSVQVGMGVISTFGVVGQVKSVSENFATVYSLLHPNLLVSSKVKRTQTICTIQWDQRDYAHSNLKYVPRHIKIEVGDTIVTSGFGSAFPSDLFVGVVSEVKLEDHMTFFEAKVRLATDFTSLHQVFVMKDLLKEEKDSLMIEL